MPILNDPLFHCLFPYLLKRLYNLFLLSEAENDSKHTQAPSTANARTPKTRQARFGEPRRGPPSSRRKAFECVLCLLCKFTNSIPFVYSLRHPIGCLFSGLELCTSALRSLSEWGSGFRRYGKTRCVLRCDSAEPVARTNTKGTQSGASGCRPKQSYL